MDSILDKIRNMERKEEKQETTPSSILISQRLIDLCNFRIQQEELSSRLYLGMSKWLTNNGYFGAGKLWSKYSKEELTHADWIYDFLLGLGIQPIIPELPRQEQSFTSLCEIINKSYDHEILVYNQCSELALTAFEEKQLMLYSLALKMTAEQHEELEKIINWKDRIKAFGEEKALLRELDDEMGGA